MKLVELLINGISYSQTQNGAYALILSEIEGERKLPIVIGTNEAQSIAIAIEKEIKPPRPLTHDLFKNFCQRFDIKIKLTAFPIAPLSCHSSNNACKYILVFLCFKTTL